MKNQIIKKDPHTEFEENEPVLQKTHRNFNKMVQTIMILCNGMIIYLTQFNSIRHRVNIIKKKLLNSNLVATVAKETK
jgi:hypothetical protein